MKGKNIHIFEKKLLDNFLIKIPSQIKDKIQIKKKRGGSIFIYLKDINKKEKENLKIIAGNTPGFSTYFFAYFLPTELGKIQEASILLAKEFNNSKIRTFGIKTEKIEKGVELKTQTINQEVGSTVYKFLKKENGKIDVNLDNPDLRVCIKVNKKETFLWIKKFNGAGGLPVGSTGRAISFLSGGIDSPVASFLALKRGLELVAVHFHSVPQTSQKSIEKVKKLLKEISKFQGNIKLYLIPIIDIQKDIVENAKREYSIILQRRLFFKIGEKISKIEKTKAFVTGDSLGQVASQTLENLTNVSLVTKQFIYRPLIALDKIEIMNIARKINTLKISEEPHEDACSLFTPKKPVTKSLLSIIKNEEEKTDSNLLDEAIKKAKIININYYE